REWSYRGVFALLLFREEKPSYKESPGPGSSGAVARKQELIQWLCSSSCSIYLEVHLRPKTLRPKVLVLATSRWPDKQRVRSPGPQLDSSSWRASAKWRSLSECPRPFCP